MPTVVSRQYKNVNTRHTTGIYFIGNNVETPAFSVGFTSARENGGMAVRFINIMVSPARVKVTALRGTAYWSLMSRRATHKIILYWPNY